MLPLRLLVAASAVGGLALTGLSPAPAHAADPIVFGSLQLQGNLNFNGTNCGGATTPTAVQADVTAAGTTVTRSLSFDQTATATGDSTDSVRFKGSQTASVTSTAAGGQVTSLTATSTVTGSVTATKTSSACAPSGFPASEGNQAQFSATVHRATAGWLRLQATSTGVGGQILQGEFGGGQLVAVTFGGFAVRDISSDQWIYVPAGDYDVDMALGGASVDGYGLPASSMKQSVKLTFVPAGSAKAAATGSARTRVVLPNVLTCSSGKAVTRLTSRIKGASKVNLYVNGVRKASVRRPTARTITLTGVPKNRAVTLKAVVVDHGKVLTASRSYRSC